MELSRTVVYVELFRLSHHYFVPHFMYQMYKENENQRFINQHK